MKKTTETYCFLFVLRTSCTQFDDLKKIVPRGCEIDDGYISYYWDVTSKHLDTAVRRAHKKLQDLNERAKSVCLEWEIDDEYTIASAGRNEAFMVPELPA